MASTRSRSAVLEAERGCQRPRICHVPEFANAAAADDAIELAAMAGLNLDDWQQFVLRNSLGERADGSWAASTVGLVCPRQNGKNAILEARELAGLFVFKESVIVHSAHEQATASEQFRRLEALIDGLPSLRRRLAKIVRGKGSEAIELTGGQRILFKTRTGGGGRGFSIDCVVFDEAYELPEAAISAIVPALSARPNTQQWYTSSAVDQEKHANGFALTRQRERGMRGGSGMAFFEWSIPGDDPARVPDEIRGDPLMWGQANPSFDCRISEWTVQQEYEGGMGAREFAVERLGVGDWPDTSADSGRIISRDVWLAAAEHDPAQRVASIPMFAVDSVPDSNDWSAIAVAGGREDGLAQFAIVEHDRGAHWVVERCRFLQDRHRKSRFVVDKKGPLAYLIPELLREGVKVLEAGTDDYGTACAQFRQAVNDGRAKYPAPQPELDDALSSARSRPMGDREKWTRRQSSSSDISPLVAATLALWGHLKKPPRARVINPLDYV